MIFNVLIVGLGKIGMSYDLELDSKKYVYSHASAFKQHPGFNLICGVDTDPQLSGFFEEKYGCRFYSDLEKALRENEPDVVVIATSTKSHKKVIKSVIKYSHPKMILCEKPLSYSLQEANEIVTLCKNKNIKLFVNYIRNSDPNIIEIRRKINSNEYAGYAKGVVWYSKGLIHNGSHFINLMEYWLGPILGNNCINKGRLFNDQDLEPDFSLTFKKGEIIFLSAREENFSHYTIEIIFENGRLKCDQGCEDIKWTPVSINENLSDYRVLSSNGIESYHRSMDKYQLNVTNELYNYLTNRNYELCSGKMAISTLKSINKIIKDCNEKSSFGNTWW